MEGTVDGWVPVAREPARSGYMLGSGASGGDGSTEPVGDGELVRPNHAGVLDAAGGPSATVRGVDGCARHGKEAESSQGLFAVGLAALHICPGDACDGH